MMRIILRVLNFFQPDSPRIAAAVVLVFCGAFASLLKPWPLALVVDGLLGDQPLPGWLGSLAAGWDKPALLALLAGLVLVLHFGQAALASAQNFLLIQTGLRGLARIRNQLFNRLQRLSLRSAQESRQGDLIYRACWDTFAFQTLFQHGLFGFLTAFLGLLPMVIVMWQLSPVLTYAALATVPLLLLTMSSLGRAMNQRGLQAQQADSQVASLVQQGIAALPLVQSYTQEGPAASRFAAQVVDSFRKRLGQHGLEVSYLTIIAFIFALGSTGIIWLGSLQVLRHELTVGQLLVFLAYLGQFYDPLNQLSHVGATTSAAAAGAQRVLEILDAPEEVRESPHARGAVRKIAISIVPTPKPEPLVVRVSSPEPAARPTTAQLLVKRTARPIPVGVDQPIPVEGRIEFDRVSFAYQPNQLVLKEISCLIHPGEVIALIGSSGSGKSTLLNLLPRFFDPVQGAVRLDGTDLRDFRLKDLRSLVAMVMQDSLLLPGTIAENIAFGKPGATQPEIEAAAQAAQAEAFIKALPKQYETVVGEGSARLSAGEKQRLSLARAFLKDAPILILDEPTSALDLETECMLGEALRPWLRGRTAIIAAHRLPTIRLADRVMVLENGYLKEFGTPAELQISGGFYARITHAECSTRPVSSPAAAAGDH